MRLHSPVAFRPGPVTIIVGAVYIGIAAVLLYVHHRVPPPPLSVGGIDLDEAWHDLQHLTAGFHPFNSRRNDEIRAWLLGRLEELTRSEIQPRGLQYPLKYTNGTRNPYIISDLQSNVSYGVPDNARRAAYSAYFESSNIMVYVRGKTDDPSDWWKMDEAPKDPQGVLVNAHFDSVSTGYGATDDGIGVVTVLQLVKYYARHQPQRGIVALLNNGEEDDLYGARVFQHHPLSLLPQTFVNLEGAGAGGRAVLFRSSDAGVSKAYEQAPYPFGSVVNADAFRRGLIKSETDYSVLTPRMRGLDIAFMTSRARYHTRQDDTRHTSKASLYHMLSAALATTKYLTENAAEDHADAVWFDLLGKTFAVFRLHTLFALEITILVVSPLVLLVVGISLRQMDRKYLFSGSKESGSESVSVKGRRGVFRWPVSFAAAIVGVVALAMAVIKINPFIIYSSAYAVWGMMMSTWILVVWTVLSAADYLRPTAFQRAFSLMWMFSLGWVVQLLAVVFDLGSTYLVFFYFSGIFIALLVCLMELYGLPPKTSFAREIIEETASDDEHTPLIPAAETMEHKSYGGEQAWAHALPSGLWILEFLCMVPFPLILTAQVALIVTAALPQTLADGSDVRLVYGIFAILTIILLTPTTPFIHRMSFILPIVCLCVLGGTVVYNMLAFPFSANNRFKVYFQQQVDLDTGRNNVSFTASPRQSFLEHTIESLPSAAGVDYTCEHNTRRKGLASCVYPGLAPAVGKDSSWLQFTMELEKSNKARFQIRGKETKACRIHFDRAIINFDIVGGDASQDRLDKIGQKGGSTELKLWSRTWNRTWEGNFEWAGHDRGMSGRVVCLWSDANVPGSIPALDEVWHYAPAWVAVTKLGDGLVEGSKAFSI